MVSINSNSAFIGTKALALKQNQPEEENNQETTVENKTENQETTKQEVAQFVGFNQIGTGTLLVNRGIRINNGGTIANNNGTSVSASGGVAEGVRIELNTNYKDYGDLLGSLRSDLESGFLEEGDRVKYNGMDGQVIMTEKGKCVLFENGTVYGLGLYPGYGPFVPFDKI